MAFLLDLPDELLSAIAHEIPPTDLLAWCCACSRISRCSQQALQAHRREYQTYRLLNDDDPQRFCFLVRSLVADNTKTFYVRDLMLLETLEKPADLSDQASLASQTPADETSYSELFSLDGELLAYRKTLQASLLSIEEVDSILRVDKARLFQMMPFAICHRLENITFSHPNYHRLRSGRGTRITNLPILLLSTSIRRWSSLPRPEWPCFQHFRSVSVGMCSKLPGAYKRYPLDDIAPLLLLPRLKTLAFDGVGGRAQRDYTWEWQPRISTCEELQIGGRAHRSIRNTSVIALISGIKSLKSLTLDIDYWAPDPILAAGLLKHAEHSLEWISIPSLSHWEYQRQFTSLRRIEIDVRELFESHIPDILEKPEPDGSNLALDPTGGPSTSACAVGVSSLCANLTLDNNSSRCHCTSTSNFEADLSRKRLFDLCASLPKSVQVVKLFSSRNSALPSRDARSLVSMLELTLEAHAYASLLPDLQTICLIGALDCFRHPAWPPSWSSRYHCPVRCGLEPQDKKSVKKIHVGMCTCGKQQQATTTYWLQGLMEVARQKGTGTAVGLHVDPCQPCMQRK